MIFSSITIINTLIHCILIRSKNEMEKQEEDYVIGEFTPFEESPPTKKICLDQCTESLITILVLKFFLI